jgi:hypothetical protein
MFLSSKFDTLDRVKEIKGVLDRIVVEMHVIMVEDSLQKLAKMGEKERNKILDNAIVQMERQQQHAAKDTMLDLENAANSEFCLATQNLPGAGISIMYLPKAVGIMDFVKKWGNRPLEDILAPGE